MDSAFFPDPYYNDFDATFGDRLSAAREKTGMMQSELADRMGVKLRTIQSWEDDKSEPRANKIQMVSALLNVPMVWLISGLGDGLRDDSSTEFKTYGDDVERNVGKVHACLTEIIAIKELMANLEKRLIAIEKLLEK